MPRITEAQIGQVVEQLNHVLGRPPLRDEAGHISLDALSTCGGRQYGGYKLVERTTGGGLRDYWPVRSRVTAKEMMAYLEGALDGISEFARLKGMGSPLGLE